MPRIQEVLTVGSLYSGIGGIDLGLTRAGMKVIWQIEVDDWCRRVLAKHWPEVQRYGDIRAVDFRALERPDVLAGGFPCQSSSHAGKRLGRDDERWLWPEFAGAIRELRPRYVLVENVSGLLSPIRDRATKRIVQPAPIDEVLGDLAASGYDAEWTSLSAAAFGAPHIRDRVFIVAYPSIARKWRLPVFKRGSFPASADTDWSSEGETVLADPYRICGKYGRGARDMDGQGRNTEKEAQERERRWDASGHSCQDVAHAACVYGSRSFVFGDRARRSKRPTGDGGSLPGRDPYWEVEPAVGRMVDGLPTGLARRHLAGLGNAVVPQIIEYIGGLIIEHERSNP